MNVKNQLAIVTGGASGLGAAAARELANAGAQIAIFDRNRELGEALADEVSGLFFEVDVTSEAQLQEAITESRRQLGDPRVLVNSAGIARNLEVLDENLQPHPLQDFAEIINVNLLGTFNCLRLFAAAAAVAPALDEGERGVIVNVASASGFDSRSDQIAYSASKAGVIGLTLGAARSLSQMGIRVVTVAPGLFDTPIVSGVGLSSEELEQFISSLSIPYPGRMGDPREFGEMVAAICKIRYLNGEVIRLDGGVRLPYSN